MSAPCRSVSCHAAGESNTLTMTSGVHRRSPSFTTLGAPPGTVTPAGRLRHACLGLTNYPLEITDARSDAGSASCPHDDFPVSYPC